MAYQRPPQQLAQAVADNQHVYHLRLRRVGWRSRSCILICRARSAFALSSVDWGIEQRAVSNLPLGILLTQDFSSSSLPFERGDMLAIVSDGFTGTFDSKGRDFGVTGIEEILQNARGKELREISTELRASVCEYGEQRDDQTILLVRRLA